MSQRSKLSAHLRTVIPSTKRLVIMWDHDHMRLTELVHEEDPTLR